jgi:adenylate kinase
MYVRTVDLRNDFEAQRFGNILEQEGIPHHIKSNHDTALDGIFQMELGWGYVMAPEESKERIVELYAEYRRSERSDSMKLIFLGPPGAGKGTLASVAKERYGVPHISTGDIFRTAIKNETELGKKVKGILASGALVPDELTIALVRDRLSQADAKAGFILDGFPRTIPQAEALEEFAPVDTAVDFVISNEAVVERLSGRRVCKGCGKNYHIKFMAPKKPGICDACGGELFTRDDDKIEAITFRLKVYRDQTEPLIAYYRGRDKLLEVDATPSPDEIQADLDGKLNG